MAAIDASQGRCSTLLGWREDDRSLRVGQGLSARGNAFRYASAESGISGRPSRMRADHSWPHRGQSYHAITHELSAAGATRCPQSGQFIDAIAESGLDMPRRTATTVPR
jgi:hypothetical protein